MFDSDKVVNFRQRTANLTPDSPYPAWHSLLEQLINIVRVSSLETGIAESATDRDARRIRINELSQQLLKELMDPDEAYRFWLEEDQDLRQ